MVVSLQHKSTRIMKEDSHRTAYHRESSFDKEPTIQFHKSTESIKIKLMKRFSVGLIAIVCCASCSQSPATSRLRQAEALIDEQPDSALALLEGMDRQTLHGKEATALYGLLLTAARYKSGIDETNDSLIQSVIGYYNRREGKYKADAYYYAGLIHLADTDYARAITDFLHAEKSAKLLKDSLRLGLVYRGIADVSDILRDEAMALSFSRKSYDCFCAAGKNKYTGYAHYDVCRAYYNAIKFDECIAFAEKAYDVARQAGDTLLMSHICRIRGEAYTHKKNPKAAWEQYKMLEALGPRYFMPSDWEYLGLLHLEEGNLQEAKVCNDSLTKHIPQEQWLTCRIHRKEGKYKEVVELLENEMHLQDSVILGMLNKTLTKSVYDHYDLQENLHRIQIEKEKQSKVVILLLGIVLVAIIAIISFFRTKIYKRNIEHTMLMAQDLRQMLSDKETAIRSVRSDVQELLASQFETLDRLCTIYYEHKGAKREKEKIYEQVMDIIKGFESDRKMTESLERIVDNKLDNLITRFKTDYPQLKEAEQRLFLFIVLGFSNRAISIFQKIKIEVVYNQKSILKKKIKGTEGTYTDEYLRFFS